jgi:site-specific recombinase XerD
MTWCGGVAKVLTLKMTALSLQVMKRDIRLVARDIGINEKIGWRTFRHTFGTLLKANGEDVKAVQEIWVPQQQ